MTESLTTKKAQMNHKSGEFKWNKEEKKKEKS